jgi:hypothetical protein
MPIDKDGGDRATTRIRWIARIWGTLILAVVLLVFIGVAWDWLTAAPADPHAVEDYAPIETLPPVFAVLSAVGLAIAWRWEGVGGAMAVAFNLAGLPVLLIHWPLAQGFPHYLLAPYGVWLMIGVPGVLYLICWWRSRRRAISPPGA